MKIVHNRINKPGNHKPKKSIQKVSTWTERARHKAMMGALKMFSEDELKQMVADSITYDIELPEPFCYYKPKKVNLK